MARDSMLNGFWSAAGCWLAGHVRTWSFLLDSDDCDLLLDGIDFNRSRSDCCHDVSDFALRHFTLSALDTCLTLTVVVNEARLVGCEYERRT